MRFGVSLFLVYLVGKAMILGVHGFDVGIGEIPVIFWQDLLVATFIAVVFQYFKGVACVLYGAAVIHFAISLPLLRVMATPLTAPLLHAGSGTLADSIKHHLDARNVALLLGTLIAGTILPFAFRRLRVKGILILPAAAFVAIGWTLTASSDLNGLHRNSLSAFALSFTSSAQAPVFAASREGKPVSPVHGIATGANLILIGLESTGTAHLSTYGAPSDPMPFLSELAREGVVFENTYAAYPESIKGLYTLLFSRQPQFGFNPEDLDGFSQVSLATVAEGAGYDTALFHSGRFMYLGMDEVVRAAGFQRADDAGAISGNHNSSFGADDISTVDHLLSWLDQRGSATPFFIHYLPISGHHPYEAPVAGPFVGGDDRSRYRNALYYSDLALRRLVEGLKARGLSENTLLVIYGDHGEAFEEHPGNYGHTLHLFEENVRVPLVVWMPAKLRPARIDRITSLVDLAPTICDLMGIEPPPPFDGLSAFIPTVRPAFFLTEYSMRIRGMRFENWKLILEHETGHVRLYDLVRDPAERTNLARTQPEIAASLRRFFEWSPGTTPLKLGPKPETVAWR